MLRPLLEPRETKDDGPEREGDPALPTQHFPPPPDPSLCVGSLNSETPGGRGLREPVDIMSDAAGLLTKLREAYKKKDLKSGKSLLGQIKVDPGCPSCPSAYCSFGQDSDV